MTKFNAAWLLRKRQFRSLAGVTSDVYRTMARRLHLHWQKQMVVSKHRSCRPWGVGGLEDHQLVLLIFIVVQ